MRSKTALRVIAFAVAIGQAGLVAGQSGPSAPQSSNETVAPEILSALEYRMVGPSRGGRATAVAGHRSEPSTFYMGATGGGVWKTTDYGRTWRPMSDGYFRTGSIGAIAVAESNPNIVYVSTGSDGLRSNVIIGTGVYKSTDAGRTWEHLGLEKTGNSGAVRIHPSDADLVYVAAIGNPFAPNPERGVYRSRDGGDTWEHVLFISERTGAVDLEFGSGDPNTIYAGMWEAERKPWTIVSGGMEGGIWKSTDGGDTWNQVTDGLPTGLRGKSDLAVSAGDPNRVYALIEAPDPEGGVFRSDDRGESWRLVSDFQPIRNRPFYYNNLHAHPTDPDTLWAAAEGFYKSVDGGRTWRSQRTPHGDNHDLWVNPDNPDLMVQSNDGGANVSRDGGQTWSTQDNQPTAELYQVDISDDFPYRLYAGQQDNSTISVPSMRVGGLAGGNTAAWESHGGCETGPAVPKPGDPDIVYANCKGRFGVWNRRTGQEQQYYVGFWNLYGRNPADLAFRFQRVVPIHVSPHNPNRVYHGSQFVHMTEDGGVTWQTISPDLTAFTEDTQMVSGGPITIDVTGEEHFAVLYDIQESPHEPGVIWAGANDGPVHVTRDSGATWTDVTPELGPYGRVQTIEVSPHDPAKTYVSILRYQVGDFSPHVYRTTDYGQSWTRITTGNNGIPNDEPVRVVREDPAREGLLYAGTEFGMYISFDDGEHWQPFQQNLPHTPVTDIKRVHNDLALSTMGRSFWIMYDVTPLHEITDAVASSEAYLFEVENTDRLRGGRGFGGGGGGGSSPATPQYPPAGAYIDYWLASEPAGELTLEILDSEGELIRGFTSSAAGVQFVLPEEPSMREWRLERIGTPRLPKEAGAHRFVWDLRHAGPWSAPRGSGGGGRGGGDGPMVPPGTYAARLSSGDWSASRTFEVVMDPRVTREGITAEDVTEQAEFALQVRDTLSNARLAALKLRQARDELSGAETDAARTLDEQLQEIDVLLNTAPRRYSPPMLLDQLSYLFGNLNQADQRPGKHAYDRHEELSEDLDQLIRDLERLLSTMR